MNKTSRKIDKTSQKMNNSSQDMNNRSRQKAVQYFTQEYLDSVHGANPEQIIEYLENFRALQFGLLSPSFAQNQPPLQSHSGPQLKPPAPAQSQSKSLTPSPSKLISLKVPPTLLQQFKAKAQARNIPYQTQIKVLMAAWAKSSK